MTEAEYNSLNSAERQELVRRITASKLVQSAKLVKGRNHKAKGAAYKAARSRYCGALQHRFSGLVIR